MKRWLLVLIGAAAAVLLMAGSEDTTGRGALLLAKRERLQSEQKLVCVKGAERCPEVAQQCDANLQDKRHVSTRAFLALYPL